MGIHSSQNKILVRLENHKPFVKPFFLNDVDAIKFRENHRYFNQLMMTFALFTDEHEQSIKATSYLHTQAH